MLDRCDPDKFSKHYPGLLTEKRLLHRYGKLCLSRGFHCTQQSFRKVKDAALKFFSDGMANGKKDSDFEHGGGSFNQECWRQGFFEALGTWDVASEKPKLSAYFSTTRDTMSNERSLAHLVKTMHARKGSPLGHFHKECLLLLKCAGPKSVDEPVRGNPLVPTEFLVRANREWVRLFGRRVWTGRKEKRDFGAKHKMRKGSSGRFMRNAQLAAFQMMRKHMLALDPSSNKTRPQCLPTHP